MAVSGSWPEGVRVDFYFPWLLAAAQAEMDHWLLLYKAGYEQGRRDAQGERDLSPLGKQRPSS